MGSAAGSHPLDNVVWNALVGRQREFSEGDDRARRYLVDVAPFAGLRDFSPASLTSLRPLASRGHRLAIFSVEPVPPADGLKVLLAETGHQMVASRVACPLQPREVEHLDDSAVPEMLALVERAQPGPFAAHTNRLGDYLGIRAGGQLVAMTGERMKLDGFTESVRSAPIRSIEGTATLTISSRSSRKRCWIAASSPSFMSSARIEPPSPSTSVSDSRSAGPCT